MNTKLAYICRCIMCLLPETKCFGIKNWLWRKAGVIIGRDAKICSSAFIVGNGEIEIGDEVWIGHQVFLETGCKVRIGSYVDIGPRVYIGTGSHMINQNGKHSAGKGISSPVIIENGVWIGANAIILPGVTIGEKAVIGAGAVVTKNIPARVLVVGCPAHVVRPI